MGSFDPKRLEAFFTSSEPEEVRRYLATPDPTALRFLGTTVPVLGARPLVQLGGGLVAPAVRTNPASYAASYLTLEEYLDLSADPVPMEISSLIRVE